jgi:stage III sporulation protein AA
MIEKLLPPLLSDAVKTRVSLDKVFELRIRLSQPVVVFDKRGAAVLDYIVDILDIEYILSVASKHSVYAISEELKRGYISAGGVRIGVAGEGVFENGKIVTIKNISSLLIRVPHEAIGYANNLLPYINKGLSNILILSPPGFGKTTLLREITRLYSRKEYNLLLVDERFEIAAVANGKAALDVGKYTDIISGIPKDIVYENAIRTMRPDMIIVDELFSEKDVVSITDIIRSGIFVAATIHAKNLRSLDNTIYDKLQNIFDIFVILNSPASEYQIVERKCYQ